MGDETTCIVQTYDGYLQQYDADKAQDGLQIDLSQFADDYKGVKIWEDDNACVGPDLDLLNLSGNDRKKIYKDITEYKGKGRSDILGRFRSNLEALRKAGWFKTGYIDYEKKTTQGGKVEWCSKDIAPHCLSAAEYLKLRRYFDLMNATAQIVTEELKKL